MENPTLELARGPRSEHQAARAIQEVSEMTRRVKDAVNAVPFGDPCVQGAEHVQGGGPRTTAAVTHGWYINSRAKSSV
jgi:hypothetical protein